MSSIELLTHTHSNTTSKQVCADSERTNAAQIFAQYVHAVFNAFPTLHGMSFSVTANPLEPGEPELGHDVDVRVDWVAGLDLNETCHIEAALLHQGLSPEVVCTALGLDEDGSAFQHFMVTRDAFYGGEKEDLSLIEVGSLFPDLASLDEPTPTPERARIRSAR